jgi:hypothetical protein
MRRWVWPTLVAVLGFVPIAGLLFRARAGLEGEEPSAFGVYVQIALIPVLTGLATALVARLRRWLLLVPAGVSLAVFGAVFGVGDILVARGSEAFRESVGESQFVIGWAAVSLGALAGVALADYLTRDKGQDGDVGEPHPAQDDAPVG